MPPPLAPVVHVDWPKVVETMLGGGGTVAAVATWLLGRRERQRRAKTEARTQDQKQIDQLIGRVSTLEDKMAEALEKIEDLRSEKMALEVKIVDLQKQIALLEVKKAEFESRESMFHAHLADLEERLAVKTEELRYAEARLKQLEQRSQGAATA